MKLQQREKFLLGVLIMLIVVVALMTLWILPQWQALQINRATLDQLNQQLAQTKETVAAAMTNKQEIETLQAEAQEITNLLRQTQSYDLSLTLSEMLSRNGLTPLSLTISEYQPAPVPEGDRTATEETGGDEAQADEETEKQTQNVALRRTANIAFSGTATDARRLVDALSAYSGSVIVDGFTHETLATGDLFTVQLVLYEFAQPQAVEAFTAPAQSGQEGTLP